jgi:diguanylate cyclase (GGDEF)-like protein
MGSQWSSADLTSEIEYTGGVPAFALAVSLAAFAVPVAVDIWFPDWTANGLGMLIWLSALIPAFLLAYYRGLRGVAVALAGGMVVITATQVSLVAVGITEPNWPLLTGMLLSYLIVALGIGGLSELLIKERRKAQALTLVDPLTELPNRRHLEFVLRSEFAAAERGHKLSLVVFDLDGFKSVNDRYGHRVGDEVLQAFAKILRTHTRLENLSARFGGEEFVSVLRDASREDAGKFAVRVLDEMSGLPLPWGRQTVSAGVAEFEPGMGSYELLIGAADLALYRAKEAGGNRVVGAPKAGEAHFVVPQPVAPQSIEPSGSPPRVSRVPAVAHAIRIWIVDDHAPVRSLLKSMLADADFVLRDTGNPLEAIRHFAEASPRERPDVILADVIMPEMTGVRMIEEILKISTDVRVIYMSSYARGSMSWGGTPGTEVAYLKKPFTREALFAALKQVLVNDAPPAGAAG